MIHFCTYCDHRYLPRALAMAESLEQHCGKFTLWMLALSKECEELVRVLQQPSVRCVPLRDLEAADSALVGAKAGRSMIEYYFTLSPCWPLHLMRTQPAIERLTYLDSDLWFFSSPDPIFRELADASVGLIPHRFPAASAPKQLRYGTYNVGWITWNRDVAGTTCLEDWRMRCLDWCHDRCEDGKFADQGYLDQWPDRFPGVHVIGHPGANVAPWNATRHALRRRNGQLESDRQPLIFYHFHGLGRLGRKYVRPNLEAYVRSWSTRRALIEMLYRPYLKALVRWQEIVACAADQHGVSLDDVVIRSQQKRGERLKAGGLLETFKLSSEIYAGKVVDRPVV